MADKPNRIGLSRHAIMFEVEESLKRLQTDYIDLYQVHGVDPLTPIDETLRALDNLVTSGKVRYLGLSNFAAWQIMKALAVSDKHSWSRFESIQAYYSIAGRELEREIVPLAQDQNMSILVWSPLAGGFLSGKFSREGDNPSDARRSQFDFPPVDKERGFDIIDKMKEIADSKNASISEIALSWCLHQPGITSVIIGAKSEQQLKQNINASNITLSADELKVLDEVSKLNAEYPGWMLQFQASERLGQQRTIPQK